MGNIVLLAETGSDIPPEAAREYGIYIVPMHVSFGKETRDDGSFPPEEVCDYYRNTGQLPKTSGSVPEDFETIFDRIHREHPDGQILYLAYSAVTTCSYQSGMIAAEGRDYVTAIDTKHVSVGQCVVVLTMAKLIREHPEWSVEEARAKAEEVSRKVHMCFVPDTWNSYAPGEGSATRRHCAGRCLRSIRGSRFWTGILRRRRSTAER